MAKNDTQENSKGVPSLRLESLLYWRNGNNEDGRDGDDDDIWESSSAKSAVAAKQVADEDNKRAAKENLDIGVALNEDFKQMTIDEASNQIVSTKISSSSSAIANTPANNNPFEFSAPTLKSSMEQQQRLQLKLNCFSNNHFQNLPFKLSLAYFGQFQSSMPAELPFSEPPLSEKSATNSKGDFQISTPSSPPPPPSPTLDIAPSLPKKSRQAQDAPQTRAQELESDQLLRESTLLERAKKRAILCESTQKPSSPVKKQPSSDLILAEITCEKCSVTTSTLYQMEKHNLLAHPDLILVRKQQLNLCWVCDQSFKRADKLIDHLKKDHNLSMLKIVPCGGCRRSYADSVNRGVHHLATGHGWANVKVPSSLLKQKRKRDLFTSKYQNSLPKVEEAKKKRKKKKTLSSPSSSFLTSSSLPSSSFQSENAIPKTDLFSLQKSSVDTEFRSSLPAPKISKLSKHFAATNSENELQLPSTFSPSPLPNSTATSNLLATPTSLHFLLDYQNVNESLALSGSLDFLLSSTAAPKTVEGREDEEELQEMKVSVLKQGQKEKKKEKKLLVKLQKNLENGEFENKEEKEREEVEKDFLDDNSRVLLDELPTEEEDYARADAKTQKWRNEARRKLSNEKETQKVLGEVLSQKIFKEETAPLTTTIELVTGSGEDTDSDETAAGDNDDDKKPIRLFSEESFSQSSSPPPSPVVKR